MALPTSGTITSADILSELGFTGSGNVLRNVVQKPGGILQVLVNSTWVNLNMCSLYLPIPVAPYIVPTHWYGYDHGTTGVELLTISGDTTIDVGQTVTYTASITGENLTGVVLTWSKFAGGAWVDNIATGTSVSITWVDPRDAKVRVIASNICNLNIVQKELNISYNCTPALSGDPYIGGTLEVNKSYDVWAVNGSGIVGEPGNTRLGISFFWEVFGSVTLVSGQGTSKAVIKATATSTGNIIRVTITSCGTSITSSNITFDASSPVPVQYNDSQSRDIQKICDGGQIGSIVTVTRAAGTHSSANPNPTTAKAEANAAAIAWLYTQDAINVAQAEGTCGDTPSVPNDRMSQLFTRNNCGTQFGSTVEYVVQAGTYRAADKAAANTLAQNDIDANGQNFANNTGTCSSVICTEIVNSLSFSLGSSFTNGIISGTYTVNVSKAGIYRLKLFFTGEYQSTTLIDLPAGSSTHSFSLNAIGYNYFQAAVLSSCSAQTYITSSEVSSTGTVACTTVGAFTGSATRSGFFQGNFTVAMNMSPFQNIRNVSGNIQFGGDTYYFSGLDFSGGNIVYQTFNIPLGTTRTGTMNFTVTGGDNICNLPLNYNNLSSVTVVSPI